MMRQLLIAFLAVICLSSCLKQSIADAMIADQNPGSKAVATLTYDINGNTVTTSVSDPDSQTSTDYQLETSKTLYPGTNSTVYIFDCLSTSGELTFIFITDSLTVGHYSYLGSYGDMFILSYNGQDEFAHDPADSISFNVTSYNKGHISGNFSGVLTPMIVAGFPNTYGTPGSVLITKGSFQDVPVFY
jgi:hypothetical protein